jgi:hypothetical protein
VHNQANQANPVHRFVLLLAKGEEPGDLPELAAHKLSALGAGSVSVVPSGDAWHDLAPEHGGNFKAWPSVLLGSDPSGRIRFDGAIVSTPRIGAGSAAVVHAFFAAKRAVVYASPNALDPVQRVVAAVKVSNSWKDGFEVRVAPL